jgi:hypothetical protein
MKEGGCRHLGAQPNECVDIDSRLIELHQACASGPVEHPTGNDDPQFGLFVFIMLSLHADHDARLTALPHPAQDDHFAIEERMKPINDPRRTELAGSVWIRCDIPTRRDCWKRAWT